jgi:hypothetical protein
VIYINVSDYKVVKSAVITTPDPEGGIGFDSRIIATMTDGTEVDIIGFFPDEISITESDVIGLTGQEVKDLVYTKDLAFISS